MHFCTANIAIGGDTRNIMYRDEYSPVSWPEVDVLREIHGHDAVTDVIPFVDVKQTPRAERERLAMKYSDKVLEDRWGGKNPPNELNAEGAKLKAGVVWMNPLSGQVEKTTAKGSEPYTPPPSVQTSVEVVGNYAVREAEAEDEPAEEEEEPAPDEDPTTVDEDGDEAPKAPLKRKK